MIDDSHLNWRKTFEPMPLAVILPVGSFEQHGPHLPFESDTILAWEVARRAGSRLGLPVLPPLPYGVSAEHMKFPGTINVEPGVYCQFLREVFLSLSIHAVRLIVVINGHGGNVSILESCTSYWNHTVGLTHVLHIFPWSLVDTERDKHAGKIESSVISHIIGLGPVRGEGKDCPHVFRLLRTDECSENGIVYPGSFIADPEEGGRLLEEMVERTVDLICDAAESLGIDLLCD